MYKITNADLTFPKIYPKATRKEPTLEDKGWDMVGDFKLRDKMDLMPQGGMQEAMCKCSSNLVFACGAGTAGKAQPYDAKVLTLNGFVDMGSLKVGDTILGVDGKPQQVLRIFEQGEKDVYGLHFDDGSYTECEKNHLWKIASRVLSSHQTYGEYRVERFDEVMRLLDNGNAVCVPYCGRMEFAYKGILPIHPYVMGAYLGGGYIPKRGNPTLACIDAEILRRIQEVGYDVHKNPSHTIDYIISGMDIKRNFEELGLLRKKSLDKFIPDSYKMSSIEDRLELLRGLIDTDGHIDKSGRLYYTTTSETLAKDIQWIIRSLGGRGSVTISTPKYKWKGEIREGRKAYSLWFQFKGDENLTYIERYKERAKKHKGYRRKAIVSYKYVGNKPCRCILVSNEDHLYITDDFIVTHNTFSLMLSALKGIGLKDYTARLISVRLQDSKKGSSIFRDANRVWGDFANCQVSASDYPTFFWSQWNNSIQLIHSNFNVDNPPEWDEFQNYAKKQQSSFIAVDEATEMRSFKMFLMWQMRNRDDSGMTPQMLLTFNPVHDHFTTRMLKDAGCLTDDWFLRPEMIGKELYFYVKGDTVESMVWGRTRQEVVDSVGGIEITEKERMMGLKETDMVKSFMVLTGEAADNKKLVASTKGGSVANLHAMGETLRSVNKGAYFGPVENETLQITRQMIHNLWVNPKDEDDTMYATMDVSGAKDNSDGCPMVIWKGLQIVAIPFYTGGNMQELVSWIDNTLRMYGVPIENFAFDATGIGYYLKDFTNGFPVTFNKRPMQEYDEYGNPINLEMYFNLRSQMLGKMKVLFERGDVSCALDKETLLRYGRNGRKKPLINILFDEMNVFTSTTRNTRIYYRSKEEYKAKFHSSPDIMDSVILRSVFEFDAKEKKQAQPEYGDDAYIGLYGTDNADLGDYELFDNLYNIA